MDYCLIDDRIANGRVVRAVEVDDEICIGKHRAVKVVISNKGHVCYVTKIVRPRTFPRQAPIGCPRKPVSDEVSLERNGIDNLYASTVACAEAELARLHGFVDNDGAMRPQYAGRDLGMRTRRVLLLPARSRASIGAIAGRFNCYDG